MSYEPKLSLNNRDQSTNSDTSMFEFEYQWSCLFFEFIAVDATFVSLHFFFWKIIFLWNEIYTCTKSQLLYRIRYSIIIKWIYLVICKFCRCFSSNNSRWNNVVSSSLITILRKCIDFSLVEISNQS